MKLHVWYDQVRHYYLLAKIHYHKNYLKHRFPKSDFFHGKDVEIRDPQKKRLATRILGENGFIWMAEHIFEKTRKEDEEFHAYCHEKEKEFAEDFEYYFINTGPRVRELKEEKVMNVEVLVKKASEFRPIWLHFKEKEDFNDLMSVLRHTAMPDLHPKGREDNVRTWAHKLLEEIDRTLTKTEGVI